MSGRLLAAVLDLSSGDAETTEVDRTTRRVALYTRISTDEVNQPYSLGAQRDRLEAYVANQPGWQITASTSSLSESGRPSSPLNSTLRLSPAAISSRSVSCRSWRV